MAAARVERRLAAILAADVVGYSRLMEANRAGTFTRLKQLRHELVEPILQLHGGRVVDLKGDGAIVEFQSVVAAVEAAVEIKRAMLARDPDLPEERRIRYRIGINIGDVIVDGETIYGDGINITARMKSLCEPGGVWLSRSVYNQVKGKLDLGFAATGLHEFKNISEAVETFRVALDGVVPVAPAPAHSSRRLRWGLSAAAALLALILLSGVWYFWPVEPALAKPSIAVLPFDNLGGDEATARLAGGITEDIITDLARFRGVDVIARNSTAVYQGKPVDIREIGRELNVRYVLQGSVRREGDELRVTTQLIDAGSGAHVWSDSWDRPAGSVFAVQTEIAEHVANRLGPYGVLSDADRAQVKRKRPEKSRRLRDSPARAGVVEAIHAGGRPGGTGAAAAGGHGGSSACAGLDLHGLRKPTELALGRRLSGLSRDGRRRRAAGCPTRSCGRLRACGIRGGIGDSWRSRSGGGRNTTRHST